MLILKKTLILVRKAEFIKYTRIIKVRKAKLKKNRAAEKHFLRRDLISNKFKFRHKSANRFFD